MARYIREDLYFSITVQDNILNVTFGDESLWTRRVKKNADRDDTIRREVAHLAEMFRKMNDSMETS